MTAHARHGPVEVDHLVNQMRPYIAQHATFRSRYERCRIVKVHPVVDAPDPAQAVVFHDLLERLDIRIQTPVLLEAAAREKFDALFGGGRRDEEKARAKERFFSHRDAFGQWDPKNQRPELWNLFNGAKQPGEHFRVFPISNWTEMNVWHYIRREGIELPSLYFAAPRQVIWRSNSWLPVSEFITLRPTEVPTEKMIRFRTLGDITITGGQASEAVELDDVIREIETSRQTERGNREDDKRSENSMEERKKEGYF